MKPERSGVFYPPFFAEQALMAFMVQKASRKADLIEYFREVLPETQDRSWGGFDENVWTKSDFNPGAAVSQIIEWDSEKILFHVSMDRLGSKLVPPMIDYGMTTDGNQRYPDCGETSLRNFFNVMLFDYKRGIFDIEVFNQIQESPDLEGLVVFDEALIHYYQSHSDPSFMQSQEARDTWASQIVARRSDVLYKKEGVEIRSMGSPDNMLNLLSQLILSNDGLWAYKLIQSTKERVNFFCEIFSQRPHRKLECVLGALPSDFGRDAMQIMFKIQASGVAEGEGEIGLINWEFHNGHFALVASSSSSDSEWSEQLITALVKQEQKRDCATLLIPALIPDDFAVLRVEIWGILNYIGGFDEGYIYNLFYCLPRERLSLSLEMFDGLVSAGKKVAVPFRAFIERARVRIPEAIDFHAAAKIEWALNCGDYPFGDPQHARGKPDAIYTRVDNDYLKRVFLVGIADQLGRTWRRRLFDYDVMIGSNVNVDDQQDALQTCLKMNEESDRSRTQSQLLARESALREFRRNNPGYIESFNTPNSNHDEIARIYADYPFEGFYLGGVEENLYILSDLGSTNFMKQDSSFMHQFWLGKVCRWTASSLEDHSGPYWVIFGYVGTAPRQCRKAQCFYRAPRHVLGLQPVVNALMN